MIKIYWNEEWLNYSDKYIPIDILNFNDDASKSNCFFRCIDPNEADYIVFPVWYEPYMQKVLEKIQKWAKEINKIVIVFQHDDLYYYIGSENTIILRHAFSKSLQKANEITIPSQIDDYVEEYFNNNLPIRKNRERIPIVGFCGNTHIEYSGQYVRSLVLSELVKSSFIRSNFILRPSFSGLLQGEQLQIVRRDMLKNMLESDYCLVVRGAGNFSLRFYEVLCLGKIPVFINTDTSLPMDEDIDYRDCGIWIEQSELPFVGEKIEWRHREINVDQYIHMQINNRKIWEKYLKWNVFFEVQLPHILDKIANCKCKYEHIGKVEG